MTMFPVLRRVRLGLLAGLIFALVGRAEFRAMQVRQPVQAPAVRLVVDAALPSTFYAIFSDVMDTDFVIPRLTRSD